MNFIKEFLRQEVPQSSRSMPAYYRKALSVSELMLAGFFLATAVLLHFTSDGLHWIPLAFLVVSLSLLLGLNLMSARESLGCFAVIVAAWLAWFVIVFGWTAGSPNILVTILSLTYFNIYVPPRGKVAISLGLIAFRVGLYAFSLRYPPVATLTNEASAVMQLFNSVLPLVLLSIHYILFSSSVQDSERQLTIHNQALHIEAGTDPLTGLPNRRALIDQIETYRIANPEEQYGIAIADIDYFKRINDTYGHNCGDYTLKELSRLFIEMSENKYTVCRWGGEEFCFFLPGMNIDQAGTVMQDVHGAVARMPLHFGDIDFSIRITVGVEENDFRSTPEEVFEQADRKLYMGKAHGRNQVVI